MNSNFKIITRLKKLNKLKKNEAITFLKTIQHLQNENTRQGNRKDRIENVNNEKVLLIIRCEFRPITDRFFGNRSRI